MGLYVARKGSENRASAERYLRGRLDLGSAAGREKARADGVRIGGAATADLVEDRVAQAALGRARERTDEAFVDRHFSGFGCQPSELDRASTGARFERVVD